MLGTCVTQPEPTIRHQHGLGETENKLHEDPSYYGESGYSRNFYSVPPSMGISN